MAGSADRPPRSRGAPGAAPWVSLAAAAPSPRPSGSAARHRSAPARHGSRWRRRARRAPTELPRHPAPGGLRQVGADPEGRQLVVGELRRPSASVLPRSTSTTWPTPKCAPLDSRVRSTAHSSFWAAMVPSNSFGGSRQMSQAPQAFRASLRRSSAAGCGGGSWRPRRCETIASSRARSIRFCAPAPPAFVDAVAGQRDVAGAVEQQGVGRQRRRARRGRSAGTSLGDFRHVEVRDEAHVRPVDAHAEGDGRRPRRPARRERNRRLRVALVLGRQPGVEGERGDGRRAAATRRSRSVLARVPQ